jgi:flap endonuclease-1
MGVQLTNLFKSQEITLEDLFDKRIAIDSFNWIYQFLTTIRQPDGEPLKDFKGRTTSHLSGLFYRTIKLKEANVKPVYVFDGKPPEFKKETNDARRDVRAEALAEWKKALDEGDMESARKHAQRSATITEDIIEQSKKLLDALGVPWLQATSEGEALCSHICANGDVYAVATQDYDSLLFGATRLLRNLSITGKKKRGSSIVTINPEMFILENVLKDLGLSRDQLIILGIVIGTDFNPGGIPGYGPKKALELVRDKKTLEACLKGLAWTHSVTPEEIFEFFKHPANDNYTIKFREPDVEAVKKLLCDEHDFSEARIDSALAKMEEKDDQSSLSRWIKK